MRAETWLPRATGLNTYRREQRETGRNNFRGLSDQHYTTYSRSAGTNSYLPVSGVISFAAGETSSDVPITIYDDGQIGAPREFSLELISASGGAWLGDRVTCLVRILDTDTTFVGSKILPNGAFASQLLGATGLPVRIEFSTNLIHWQVLQTFMNSSGTTPISDLGAPSRERTFYRAVVP